MVPMPDGGREDLKLACSLEVYRRLFDRVVEWQDFLESGDAEDFSDPGIRIGNDELAVRIRHVLECPEDLCQIARIEVFDVGQVERQAREVDAHVPGGLHSAGLGRVDLHVVSAVHQIR